MSKGYNGKQVNICGIIHTIKEIRDVFDSDTVHLGQR